MDAPTATVVGAAVGGVIGMVSAFGAAWFQVGRDRDLWRRNERVRQTDAEFLAIAEYLAAAGAWRTRLASYRAMVSGGTPPDPDELDASANLFYRRRYAAEIVVGEADLRAQLAELLASLEDLFELAKQSAAPADWDRQWAAVEARLDATKDLARRVRDERLGLAEGR